jgi:NADPH:quinone reductase-like Zn-dependent oxidoreductase
MKAWQYGNERGGLSNLHLNNAAKPPQPPKPGSQLVLIEVISMAVNPADYKLPLLPLLPRFLIPKPASPGFDFCGRVVSSADGMKDHPGHEPLKAGQLVFGRFNWPYQHGTLAQFILCPRTGIAPLPSGVDIDHAAAIGVAGQTAYQSVVPYVKEGSKVFVNGGSGGVGIFTIQIAKILGCHVTVSCSGRNAEFCKSLGADEVVDYTQGSLAQMLSAKGQVFDLLVDNVGMPFDLYKASDAFLAPGAPFVQVAASGDSLQGVLEMAKRWGLPRFLGGGKHPWKIFSVKDSAEELVRVGQWVKEGKIKVVLDEVFEYGDAPKAYEKLKTGRARGKIVVHVTERPEAGL